MANRATNEKEGVRKAAEAVAAFTEWVRSQGSAQLDEAFVLGFITCPGVKETVDGFMAGHGESFIAHGLDSGQCLMVRTR